MKAPWIYIAAILANGLVCIAAPAPITFVAFGFVLGCTTLALVTQIRAAGNVRQIKLEKARDRELTERGYRQAAPEPDVDDSPHLESAHGGWILTVEGERYFSELGIFWHTYPEALRVEMKAEDKLEALFKQIKLQRKFRS